MFKDAKPGDAVLFLFSQYPIIKTIQKVTEDSIFINDCDVNEGILEYNKENGLPVTDKDTIYSFGLIPFDDKRYDEIMDEIEKQDKIISSEKFTCSDCGDSLGIYHIIQTIEKQKQKYVIGNDKKYDIDKKTGFPRGSVLYVDFDYFEVKCNRCNMVCRDKELIKRIENKFHEMLNKL